MNRIEKLQDMLEKMPGDSFIQHAMALEYIKLGDDAKAREFFENILSSNPAYIGSYYHLAKLHERNGNGQAAIEVYEKGMEMSKIAGDNHTYNELRAAYEELVY